MRQGDLLRARRKRRGRCRAGPPHRQGGAYDRNPCIRACRARQAPVRGSHEGDRPWPQGRDRRAAGYSASALLPRPDARTVAAARKAHHLARADDLEHRRRLVRLERDHRGADARGHDQESRKGRQGHRADARHPADHGALLVAVPGGAQEAQFQGGARGSRRTEGQDHCRGNTLGQGRFARLVAGRLPVGQPAFQNWRIGVSGELGSESFLVEMDSDPNEDRPCRSIAIADNRRQSLMLRMRHLLPIVFGLAVGLLPGSTNGVAQTSCMLPESFGDPHRVIHDAESLVWVRPLNVDADGAPNAYHRDDPHGRKGLAIEYLGNGMSISRNGEEIPFEPEERDNAEWLEAYRKIVRNGWEAPPGYELDIYGFARDG